MPYLLFAYHEVPQETTGFSPFDLLYGCHVRGPLDVLREGWTGDKEAAVPVNTYVVEMRQRLADMAQLVAEHSSRSQEMQKLYYDTRAKARSFKVGDKVLVLLLTTANRLKLRWTGLFKVTRKLGTVDYEVETPGRRQERKVYHVNLMKKWYVMPSQPSVQAVSMAMGPAEAVPESEDTQYWQKTSEEQFFPLEVDGVLIYITMHIASVQSKYSKRTVTLERLATIL